MQRGTSVLPQSSRPERIASNLDVLSWSLEEADMAALGRLEHQQRMVPGANWLDPAGPCRTLAELWDEQWPYLPCRCICLRHPAGPYRSLRELWAESRAVPHMA